MSLKVTLHYTGEGPIQGPTGDATSLGVFHPVKPLGDQGDHCSLLFHHRPTTSPSCTVRNGRPRSDAPSSNHTGLPLSRQGRPLRSKWNRSYQKNYRRPLWTRTSRYLTSRDLSVPLQPKPRVRTWVLLPHFGCRGSRSVGTRYDSGSGVVEIRGDGRCAGVCRRPEEEWSKLSRVVVV